MLQREAVNGVQPVVLLFWKLSTKLALVLVILAASKLSNVKVLVADPVGWMITPEYPLSACKAAVVSVVLISHVVGSVVPTCQILAMRSVVVALAVTTSNTRL